MLQCVTNVTDPGPVCYNVSLMLQTLGQCVCSDGYGGEDCNKTVGPDAASFQSVYDPWRMLGPGAFNSSLARTGHSLVTCDGNLVYMFGGYSLSHDILNDLWRYNIATNQWTLLKPANEEEPAARYVSSSLDDSGTVGVDKPFR